MQNVFEIQITIQNLLDIQVGDNPEYFQKALWGMVEEAVEASKEDTRWKANDLKLPGYKHKLDKVEKSRELADVLIQVVNACIFSDISSEELMAAVQYKQNSKLEKFTKLKGEN